MVIHCRIQDVVRSQHEYLSLEYCSGTKRQVNRHLVSVEVCVEGRTGQRMQPNGLSFDHLWLKF